MIYSLLKKSLNNEKFLCFLSSSISPPVLGMGSITVQWTNNDLNQMIMYYDDSSITSDEGWLKDYKNTYMLRTDLALQVDEKLKDTVPMCSIFLVGGGVKKGEIIEIKKIKS